MFGTLREFFLRNSQKMFFFNWFKRPNPELKVSSPVNLRILCSCFVPASPGQPFRFFDLFTHFAAFYHRQRKVENKFIFYGWWRWEIKNIKRARVTSSEGLRSPNFLKTSTSIGAETSSITLPDRDINQTPKRTIDS